MGYTPNLLKGSLYVLLAFFCMAVFGVLTKAASKDGAEIWISFITYLSATIIFLPFVFKKGLGYFKTQHPFFHLGRSAFGLAASFLYMISMHYIPMVNATLLFNTTPIFIPLLAIAFLKVSITRSTWLAVFLGFIGIIIIIKPDANILTQPGNLIGLASGISLAIAYFLIKLLTPTDPKLRIIFYFFVLSTLIQIPLIFYAGSLPTLQNMTLAVLAGITFLLAQIFLVEGYEYADASQVGVYQYSSIVFVGVIDWIIWDIVPSFSELIGVLLVVCAGFIIIRSGAHNNKTH